MLLVSNLISPVLVADFLCLRPLMSSACNEFLKRDKSDKYQQLGWHYPAGNYMFKVNNENTRTRCETRSKLTIKTPWRRSGVFIVNVKHISYLSVFC